MSEIIINKQKYFLIKDAAKLAHLSENSLRGYLYQKKYPKLDSYINKIGATLVISQAGIEYLNNEVNRVQGKKRIKLGGIDFPSKQEAADYFGFAPSDLSRYLKVKKAIKAKEETHEI